MNSKIRKNRFFLNCIFIIFTVIMAFSCVACSTSDSGAGDSNSTPTEITETPQIPQSIEKAKLISLIREKGDNGVFGYDPGTDTFRMIAYGYIFATDVDNWYVFDLLMISSIAYSIVDDSFILTCALGFLGTEKSIFVSISIEFEYGKFFSSVDGIGEVETDYSNSYIFTSLNIGSEGSLECNFAYNVNNEYTNLSLERENNLLILAVDAAYNSLNNLLTEEGIGLPW